MKVLIDNEEKEVADKDELKAKHKPIGSNLFSWYQVEQIIEESYKAGQENPLENASPKTQIINGVVFETEQKYKERLDQARADEQKKFEKLIDDLEKFKQYIGKDKPRKFYIIITDKEFEKLKQKLKEVKP